MAHSKPTIMRKAALMIVFSPPYSSIRYSALNAKSPIVSKICMTIQAISVMIAIGLTAQASGFIPPMMQAVASPTSEITVSRSAAAAKETTSTNVIK